MIPSDVLDCQHDLLERLSAGTGGGLVRYLTAVEPEVMSDQGMDWLRASVRTAYAYRVSPDMCLLTQHAASNLDDTDRYDRSLAPTGAGLVRFESPLMLFDIRGREMHIDWVVWGPVSVNDRAGTMVALFNDVNTPDEVGAEIMAELAARRNKDLDTLRRDLGRWWFIGVAFMPDGNAIGPAEVPREHRSDDGENWVSRHVPTYTNSGRLIHALWLLLGQTIVNVDEAPIQRATAKRARRMGLPGKITVIEMRRVAGANREPGESHVEWSHRWIVRGHWRWQAYGVGRTERRRIWIAPFVKGPDDAPLIQTDKVYDFRR